MNNTNPIKANNTTTTKATKATKRLKAVKAARKAEKIAVEKLQSTIFKMQDVCNLDEERTARRVVSAMDSRNEYGRVNGLINLIVAIAKWPAEQGDASMIATNKVAISRDLKLDVMLLEDIGTVKGYHSFHTDELEVIEGVEPDYLMYEDNCTILLEELGLKSVSASIDPAVWTRNEARALKRAQSDVVELRQAAEAHKAAMA